MKSSSLSATKTFLFVVFAVCLALLIFIKVSYAQQQFSTSGGLGAAGTEITGADAQCNPVILQCGCGMIPNPNPQGPKCIQGANMWMCTCSQSDGAGFNTSGQCVAPMKCLAKSTSGQNGQSQSANGLSQLAGQLGQLLGQLMKSSSSGDSGSSPTTSTTGCTTAYYYTSNTALIGVDPCALYQASAASNLTTPDITASTSTSAQDLLDALTGTNAPTTATTTTSSLLTSSVPDSLNANPSSGSAPLMVVFSTIPNSTDTGPFTVNFGDGSTPQSLISNGCTNASTGCLYSVTYTYTNAGTFTANLLDANGVTLASANVSVTNPGGPNTTQSGSGLSGALTNIGNFLEGTAASSTPTAQGPTESFSNLPGVFGNILLDNSGATIFASTISGSSETSGFYGADTLNGTPQSVAGELCENRPWANNFLADVIPPSFFDSLCQWGGYQVGQPVVQQAAAPQVTLQQTEQQPVQHAAATTTAATSTVPAQAEIWAVPSEVPLGARTSVFWQAQGVTSCTETSPDGSFSESSLSGAASTVPLTGATTYSISCTDPNGNPVTNYVTVSISS